MRRGSITQGRGLADIPREQFARRFAAWLDRACPVRGAADGGGGHEVIVRGWRGRDSRYGVHALPAVVARDLNRSAANATVARALAPRDTSSTRPAARRLSSPDLRFGHHFADALSQLRAPGEEPAPAKGNGVVLRV